MLIGLYLSTAGGSPLQVGIERGLPKLGVNVEYFQPGRPYDYVFVFNQCAHTTNYCYQHLHELAKYNKLAFIDTAEFGWIHRRPQEANTYYSTFAEGAMGHDTKNRAQQQALFNHLKGKSFPYFLREYLKFFKYPAMYHPIDYPLYLMSECHEQPNREQYLKRDLELFVSWGASHPFRMNLTNILRNCHRKCEISVIEERVGNRVTPRMPQQHYFDRMRAAKMTVSYDGYGSSSFREMEAICRTMLLKGETSIIQRNALKSGVHCIEFQVTANEDGSEFVSSNLGELLVEYLSKPEKCFEIYEAGYRHCMEHFTETKTAEYVLNVVRNHNYNEPTPLLLV